MNPSLVALIYFLAVMRVTRLINYDTILDWLHNLVGSRVGPGSVLAEFLVCPWCIGMWVGLGSAWAPLILIETRTPAQYAVSYVMLALAASMVTGLMARFSAEDTAMEPLEQQGRLP